MEDVTVNPFNLNHPFYSKSSLVQPFLKVRKEDEFLSCDEAIYDQDEEEYADVLARMTRYNLAVKGNDRYDGYPALTWKKITQNARKSQKPSKMERNRQVGL